ncbi:MAG: tRNA (adenosine(37)-N6)-dimethylallyltransferase MiaA [Candidatus Eremiobacteraeota bacterium]|nr:tRNA (adenosine(37)-N6)-dimethylallyltransferase MiaA [Candidatus Eremiobacteraeota bacterium]
MTDGVLILTGTTASGKSELAVELARKFGAEIVNTDSRQIYRGMPIGTAAPTEEQLRAVRHHLVGFLDPRERYSAAQYRANAMVEIDAIHAHGKRVIVAGGTGFYIRALLGGVELAPQRDPQVRERLAHEAKVHDAVFLHSWLQLRDPKRAQAVHPGDGYRILRALEVALSAVEENAPPTKTLLSEGIPVLKVFLSVDADELQARIERRTDQMLDSGLLEEAERVGSCAVAANAVGFPQALAYLDGWCTRSELRTLLIRATRRYAKRQQTWFRSEPKTLWCARDAVEKIVQEKLGWN